MANQNTADEAANIIVSWDTDDDCSDEDDMHFADSLGEETAGDCSNLAVSDAESSDNSDDESDSEQANLMLPQTATLSSNQVLGRNGALWERFSSRVTGRIRAHNIFTASSGVPGAIARGIVTPYDAWKHFIHESILRNIVKYTNEEAQRRGATSFLLDLQKLEAFIGLQYARGIYGKGHPVAFLWSKSYGIPIFYETMGRNLFLEILKFMRFDDKPNRNKRGPDIDKFAPIREVFEKFTSLCQSKYVCDFSLTVDEQLMPCKSRCSFITFMPNKPEKYGIKFWVIVDVNSKYVSNIIPYLGAQEKDERGGVPLAESVVMKLAQHVTGKGYNITCDNFFTSLQLAKRLANEKISIVGTMRKNRRELSKKMTEAENGGLHSSQFFWNSDSEGLFVKYQPKSKKTVCMLSSMHRSPDVDQTTVKKKPEIVLFYNKNKVGVDCFDQMARLYTTRSATRRWPMSVWGNMLDIAAINAWILYKKSTRKQISRRKFILCLVETLINRMANNSADSDLPQCRPNSTATRKRRHCHGANCKNITVTLCMTCNRPSCGSCSQNNTRVVYVKCKQCASSQ